MKEKSSGSKKAFESLFGSTKATPRQRELMYKDLRDKTDRVI